VKKQYTIIALLLTTAMVLTGCSWEEFKAKFVGGDSASPAAVTATDTATGVPIAIESYNVEECVTLAEYKGIEVDCTVTDDEVQAEIDNLLTSYPNVKKIKKGKVSLGQTANINFEGKIDGKAFDGGSAEGYSMTVGASGFIEGFDDGVNGMKVGETKDLNLKFPAEYPNKPELAGKDVVFTVKVNYIEKPSKAEFNDKFVKKYTDYKTVAEYKKKTKVSMAKTKEMNAAATALGEVMDKSTFNKIPATLVKALGQQLYEMQVSQIESQYGAGTFEVVLGQSGMTKEQFQEQINAAAESSAKVQLIVEAIAKKEGIAVDEESLKQYVSETVKAIGVEEAEYRKQYTAYYGYAVPFDDYAKTSYLYTKVNEIIGDNVKLKK